MAFVLIKSFNYIFFYSNHKIVATHSLAYNLIAIMFVTIRLNDMIFFCTTPQILPICYTFYQYKIGTCSAATIFS